MSQTKAQLLNPSGNVDFSGQLTGVGATFTANIAAVDGVFTGNVTVGGTLTKQDVTNVDSVGVITARSGIKVTAGGVEVSAGDIIVGDNISHLGDTDTKIAFTNNQIDFHANNSSRLYVNQYAAYLQTAYPLAFLSSSGASPSIKSGGTNNQDLLLTTGTSNPTRIHIKSDGKIGIGTNNPSSQLDLSGTNTTVWPFTSDVSNVYAYSPYPHELQIQNHARDVTGAFAGIYFHSGASSDGSYVSAARIAAIDSGNYKSDLAFGTRNTAFKERLRITAEGKVGIATDAPADAWLDIASTAGTESIRMRRLSSDVNVASNWALKPYGKNLYFREGASSPYDRVHFTDTGNVVATGAISDSKGDLRIIPRNNQGSAYTLVASDVGKCITAGGNITVDNSIFAAGDVVSIIADTGSTISIVQGSGVTMYNTGDASTGSKTLASRGMCTIWFVAANNCYLSGSGIS